jgi:cytochrome b561
MPEAKIKENAETTPAVYSPAARHLHWTTVALIAAQVPLGGAMSYRGNVLNLWDALTNALYSWHKLIGVVILLLVIVRLAYRLTRGAPSDEPTLEPWQKLVSHATHWAIYGLLLLVPITGWIGVSYYPALSVFGFNLPALVSPDQAAAAKVFFAHMIGAILLVILIGMHIGAALFHYVIRKDGVLNRMLPSLPRRDGK